MPFGEIQVASPVKVKSGLIPRIFRFHLTFKSRHHVPEQSHPGSKVPDAFNVIIEIPMNSDPVKYEVDKESGALFVDRFMGTAMHYPTNYGYVPQTIAGDGDPVDVLVMTPFPLPPGVVVSCRAIGILLMEDEGGMDGKILAVPTEKSCLSTPTSRPWPMCTSCNSSKSPTSLSITKTWKKANGSRSRAGKASSPPPKN
jgi:inorganic pyrophosphatase